MTNDTPEYLVIQMAKNRITVVSLEDSDLLEYKWCLMAHRYAGNRKHPYMHRLILSRMLNRSLTAREIVDHIDGDGLNNRRCNLRLANNSLNGANRPANSNNTTGMKGVVRSYKKWEAQIRVNGEIIKLGTFSEIKDAARAYNEAAIKYFGEFAHINILSDF